MDLPAGLRAEAWFCLGVVACEGNTLATDGWREYAVVVGYNRTMEAKTSAAEM